MASATGANTTPLGRLNPVMSAASKAAAGGGSSLLKPSYIQVGITSPTLVIPSPIINIKRERENEEHGNASLESPVNWSLSGSGVGGGGVGLGGGGDMSDKKRKRRSRWGGDDKDKVFIPGMPTVLPNNLSADQEKAYLLQLQIEEISRRLRTGDLGIAPNPEERSPSPEPIYNSEGKRLNTREYRTRKKFDDDRHYLIQEMFKVNPEYKPPADYKPPMIRVCEKVMIPQDEHPDINFVGLLIGPRGNTLKSMEKDTGAKIIIRGKGSVKEGKVGRKDGQPLPGEDEPLHAFVTATNPDAVKRAVDKIRDIIRQGVEVPEGQNDLRRMQLRELALLNGTLREIEGPRCTNCGATNHRSWQCPDKPNITNNVICTNCGGAGHISRDCREKRGTSPPGVGSGGGLGTGPGNGIYGNSIDKSKIDEEYMSLMAELGEGPPPPVKSEMSSNSYSSMSSHQGPQRAIMAPPSSSSSSSSSSLNNNQAPSQQSQQNWMGGKPAQQMGMNAVPPPGQSGSMQQQQQQQQQMSQNMMVSGPPVGVPPPPGTTGQGMPQMMMSPWQQHQGMNMNQGQNYFSSFPGQMGQMGMQQGGGGCPPPPPPPGMMTGGGQQQHAPPPPPGSQQMNQQQHSMNNMNMPWMNMHHQGGMQMQNPWQQNHHHQQMAPNPMQSGHMTSYPWMGYLGMPPPPPGGAAGGQGGGQVPLPPGIGGAPPPPPPPSTASNQTVDLAALAKGLPKLLAAPPPPPPPS